MAHHTHHHRFPVWMHRILLSPMRYLHDPPGRLLGPHVSEGMTVFEPGPGLGWFTLPLARLVGPTGRVIVAEIEPQVLEGLKARAAKAGLLERLDCRLGDAGAALDGLDGRVDFALASGILHELDDLGNFLARLVTALKPGAGVLVLEPRGPVNRETFQSELDQARAAGLEMVPTGPGRLRHRALLAKPK